MILSDLTISCFIKSAICVIATAYTWSLLKIILRNTLLPIFFSQRKNIRKYGNWIIITGATDGIGKGFAEVLAKEGYNLVLISRTESKLNDVRKSILEKNPNIQIKVISYDFTKINGYEIIDKEIADLEVGLLINNVGMSSAYPDYLTSDNNPPESSIINVINCNCIAATYMTRIVLTSCKMQKRGGFIINISSGAGDLKTPFLSVYSATKSYLNTLSECLISELRHTKVVIQNVAPYLVSTKMSKVRPSLIAPSANSYANSVLNRLGTTSFTNGCFIHELLNWFLLELLPKTILVRTIYSNTLKIRDRALKKLSKIN